MPRFSATNFYQQATQQYTAKYHELSFPEPKLAAANDPTNHNVYLGPWLKEKPSFEFLQENWMRTLNQWNTICESIDLSNLYKFSWNPNKTEVVPSSNSSSQETLEPKHSNASDDKMPSFDDIDLDHENHTAYSLSKFHDVLLFGDNRIVNEPVLEDLFEDPIPRLPGLHEITDRLELQSIPSAYLYKNGQLVKEEKLLTGLLATDTFVESISTDTAHADSSCEDAHFPNVLHPLIDDNEVLLENLMLTEENADLSTTDKNIENKPDVQCDAPTLHGEELLAQTKPDAEIRCGCDDISTNAVCMEALANELVPLLVHNAQSQQTLYPSLNKQDVMQNKPDLLQDYHALAVSNAGFRDELANDSDQIFVQQAQSQQTLSTELIKPVLVKNRLDVKLGDGNDTAGDVVCTVVVAKRADQSTVHKVQSHEAPSLASDITDLNLSDIEFGSQEFGDTTTLGLEHGMCAFTNEATAGQSTNLTNIVEFCCQEVTNLPASQNFMSDCSSPVIGDCFQENQCKILDNDSHNLLILDNVNSNDSNEAAVDTFSEMRIKPNVTHYQKLSVRPISSCQTKDNPCIQCPSQAHSTLPVCKDQASSEKESKQFSEEEMSNECELSFLNDPTSVTPMPDDSIHTSVSKRTALVSRTQERNVTSPSISLASDLCKANLVNEEFCEMKIRQPLLTANQYFQTILSQTHTQTQEDVHSKTDRSDSLRWHAKLADDRHTAFKSRVEDYSRHEQVITTKETSDKEHLKNFAGESQKLSSDPLEAFIMMRTSTLLAAKVAAFDELPEVNDSRQKSLLPASARNTSIGLFLCEPIEEKEENCAATRTEDVIEITLQGDFERALSLLEIQAKPIIMTLSQSGVMACSNNFLALAPDITRFILNQHIKTLQDSGTSWDQPDTVYCLVLALHGLVKAADCVLHRSLECAISCLTGYQQEHEQLLKDFFDGIRAQLIEFKGDASKKNVQHPKLHELLKEVNRGITAVSISNNSCSKVIIVVTKTYSDNISCILEKIRCLSGVKLGIVKDGEDRTTFERLKPCNVMLVMDYMLPGDFLWSDSNFIIEYEHHPESLALELSRKYGVSYTGLRTMKPTQLTPNGNIENAHYTLLCSGSASSLETLPKDGDLRNIYPQLLDNVLCCSLIMLLCSTKVVQDSELIQFLERSENFQLVERDYASLQKTGKVCLIFADLTIDERNAIILRPFVTLLNNKNLYHLINTLLALSLKYCKCWVIFHEPGFSDSCMASDNLTKLHAAVALLSSKLSVKIVYASSKQQVAHHIRLAAETACKESTVWKLEEWLQRSWINRNLTAEEAVLLSFPCLNAFSAQAMLSCASLKTLFSLPDEDLEDAFPWLMPRSMTMFHRLANVTSGILSKPLTSYSIGTSQDYYREDKLDSTDRAKHLQPFTLTTGEVFRYDTDFCPINNQEVPAFATTLENTLMPQCIKPRLLSAGHKDVDQIGTSPSKESVRKPKHEKVSHLHYTHESFISSPLHSFEDYHADVPQKTLNTSQYVFRNSPHKVDSVLPHLNLSATDSMLLPQRWDDSNSAFLQSLSCQPHPKQTIFDFPEKLPYFITDISSSAISDAKTAHFIKGTRASHGLQTTSYFKNNPYESADVQSSQHMPVFWNDQLEREPKSFTSPRNNAILSDVTRRLHSGITDGTARVHIGIAQPNLRGRPLVQRTAVKSPPTKRQRLTFSRVPGMKGQTQLTFLKQ